MSKNFIYLNSVGSVLVPSTLKVYPVEPNGHAIFDPCLGTPLESCDSEWVAALDDHDWGLVAEAADLTEEEVACAKELAADHEPDSLAAIVGIYGDG
tara:strand:- start:23485 stop:23775 length:291 start_codon:yes stop_codon:yes gene_type:complete